MSVGFAAASLQRLNKGTTLGGFSFSLWFYPTDSGLDCTLFSESNLAVTNYYDIQILGSTTDQVLFRSVTTAGGGGTGGATSTGTVNYNAWNHVYAARGVTSHTAGYISLNGEALVTGGFSAPTGTLVPNLGSRRTAAGTFYTGRLAEFAVWNNCLNDYDDRWQCLSQAFDPRLVAQDPGNSFGGGALQLVSYAPLIGPFHDLMSATAWTGFNTPTPNLEHPRMHRNMAA